MNTLMAIKPMFLRASRRLLKTGVETHYDVLRVKMDCSSKEIRNAFLKLSKEFHPDTNKLNADPSNTALFIKISEAYHVLSRPSLRCAYDRTLRRENFDKHRKCTPHRASGVRPVFRPTVVNNSDDGDNRQLENWQIALILMMFCLFGSMFGFVVARQSALIAIRQMNAKSALAKKQYEEVRNEAEKLTKEQQIQGFMDRNSNTNDPLEDVNPIDFATYYF